MLRAEAAERDDVEVVDWAARTRHDDSLVGADGLHLSERGQGRPGGDGAPGARRRALGSFGECLDD